MSDIYAIYGSGGHGREVMPLLRDYVKAKHNSDGKDCLFIDDYPPQEKRVNGHEIVSFDQFIQSAVCKQAHCCIAIADKTLRQKLTQRCNDHGIKILTLIAKNAVIMDQVNIKEGAIISPFVTLSSNITIGKSFHANIYSYVAHDCVIGDFVTFAPAVKCNGNVHIHDGVYIGTGAIIFNGRNDKPLVIGRNSKIGAGAVVTKSLPENITVIGNPARILSQV